MKQKLLILLTVFFNSLAIAQGEFITKWQLPSGTTSIRFNVQTSAITNYSWVASPSGNTGSSTVNHASLSQLTINGLPDGELITLTINPTIIRFAHSFDGAFLVDIVQWGTANWTSMDMMLQNSTNLVSISATDIPNLSALTNMNSMFRGCTNLTSVPNINSWDVSKVTSMFAMFFDASSFNQPLDNWNISAVTELARMFRNASSFNQPIGNWNTSNVENIYQMFQGATVFNQPIGNWNISKVTTLDGVFRDAKAFNQNISNWNTANVTDMGSLFQGATAFNQPISNWNTSKLETYGLRFTFSGASSFNQNISNWDVSRINSLYGTFSNAASFNQPIGNWDISNVTDLYATFQGATAFNQNINSWNTSNVTDMHGTFSNATSFNQPLNNWDVSKVTTMFNMFGGASSFNQSIGNWNTANVTNMHIMFTIATSFNQPLNNWNVSKVTTMASMFNRAEAFNQPLNNWDVSSVTNMYFMFKDATAFNQSLGSWNLTNVNEMQYMLDLCGMDCYHFSETLIGWSANSNTPSLITIGTLLMTHGSNAVAARDNLINNKSWTFSHTSGGTADCSQAPPVVLVSASIVSFTQTLGTPSNEQAFTISGSNLTSNVVITAPQFYEVSTSSSSGFSSSVSITPSSGTVSTTTIYLRLNANTLGAHSGNVQLEYENGTKSVQFAVSGETVNTTVSTLETQNLSFKLYPNPSINQLFIDFEMPTQIEIYSVAGKLVDKYSANKNHIIDISLYPAGMYLVKTDTQTLKFIKQ